MTLGWLDLIVALAALLCGVINGSANAVKRNERMLVRLSAGHLSAKAPLSGRSVR